MKQIPIHRYFIVSQTPLEIHETAAARQHRSQTEPHLNPFTFSSGNCMFCWSKSKPMKKGKRLNDLKKGTYMRDNCATKQKNGMHHKINSKTEIHEDIWRKIYRLVLLNCSNMQRFQSKIKLFHLTIVGVFQSVRGWEMTALNRSNKNHRRSSYYRL